MTGRLSHASLAVVTLLALAGGCDSRKSSMRMESAGDSITRPRNSALLFGPEQDVALITTAVGRSEWPASDDGYRLPDYSVYQEFYYDTTGNRFNEQNFPRRTTWGYRVTGVER